MGWGPEQSLNLMGRDCNLINCMYCIFCQSSIVKVSCWLNVLWCQDFIIGISTISVSKINLSNLCSESPALCPTFNGLQRSSAKPKQAWILHASHVGDRFNKQVGSLTQFFYFNLVFVKKTRFQDTIENNKRNLDHVWVKTTLFTLILDCKKPTWQNWVSDQTWLIVSTMLEWLLTRRQASTQAAEGRPEVTTPVSTTGQLAPNPSTFRLRFRLIVSNMMASTYIRDIDRRVV